ncbi:rhamnogalacturonan acetylesterase [Catenovulum sp. 2E275]|uniref:rhamnogalacturonan acetylesterase n=1 Tax=Catenovulum sp. 2E275 TaxID=2980497 RepID=UPI0021D07CD6|nr:rhamnogalacturonan acetylesterase [Catenovulum sp. 2E275]MCU4674150.1 rhamnogalacturonan acetylesterase [Catenovulum sp. 2E275]
MTYKTFSTGLQKTTTKPLKSALAAGIFGAALFNPLHANEQNTMQEHYQFDFQTQTELLTQSYNQKLGYGKDNFKNSTENAFSVKAPEGQYKVELTVEAKKSTDFLVFSEDRRVMTSVQHLNANDTKNFTFYVDMKTPYLDKAEQDKTEDERTGPKVGLRGDEDISRNWDDKLTIALSNQDVEFSELKITPSKVNRILIAGDSTVADQASSDYASWGQFMPALVNNKLVINHARSGETMKSFIFSLRWDKLMSQTQAGDIVLIQFAHNDEKKQWPRTYSAADGAYPEYLRALVADVRQREAYPVIITPVARRHYKNGQLINTHEGYDAAVRKVGRDINVPVIDLTAQTTAFYQQLGQDSPKAFAAQGKDKTHHNHYGAWVIANMVAQNLQTIHPDLVKTAPVELDLTDPVKPEQKDFPPALWPDMRPVKVKISGN